MLKVLYTGAFRFPDQDAAAFRVYTVAKLFERGAAKVTFAGWEGASKRIYDFEGHKCYGQAEFRTDEKNLISRLFGFLFRGYKTLFWLVRNNNFDCVVIYNPPAFFALSILLLSKVRRFNVILDVTEWYESSHLPGGKYGVASFENFIRMRLVYPMFSNVIVISTYLLKHLRRAENKILVPPLISDEALLHAKDSSLDVVKFLYAGDMGRKDNLSGFVSVLEQIELQSGKEIELHIVGCSEEVFLNALAEAGVSISICQGRVFFYGRVPRAKVFELYRQCHFSVFFRQRARYAIAGFPTKAVESLSHGCPVVTNKVGDIGDLLSNGENSFLIDEASAHDIGLALKELTPERYSMMRESAYALYKQRFTVSANVEHFKKFMSAFY